MSLTAEPGSEGRRSRNMRDKKQRIFEAAATLFTERGYSGVTSQQISERADVAAGTLFRYAASKGELLLMVYNEEFRVAIDRGRRAAQDVADVADAVVAMIAPIIELADQAHENGVWYQRELMFGPATERYRAEGLTLVALLEEAIARTLLRASAGSGVTADPLPEAALAAGRTVFAVVHLAAVRTSAEVNSGRDALAGLRGQIRQIVAGYLAGA